LLRPSLLSRRDIRGAEVALEFVNRAEARFKNCTEPVRHNRYRFWRDFGQLVLVLQQICSIAQLFSPRFRATFERKLKYEIVHRIVYSESLPVAGSKGVPRQALPHCGTGAIFIFSVRTSAKSNRY
jgi:hypothetical protein